MQNSTLALNQRKGEEVQPSKQAVPEPSRRPHALPSDTNPKRGRGTGAYRKTRPRNQNEEEI